MTVQLGFAEYVETLYRVHQSSFVGEEKGVHDVIHGAEGVSVLYQVLGETGFAISVFEVAQVFSEAGVKRSSCLSCVFHVAGGAGYLVYP